MALSSAESDKEDGEVMERARDEELDAEECDDAQHDPNAGKISN